MSIQALYRSFRASPAAPQEIEQRDPWVSLVERCHIAAVKMLMASK